MGRAAIKALTVCVNFDDILRLTLPRTLPHVDKLLVITSSKDERTQAYLREQDPDKVLTLVTDVFYENGAVFNKGAAIEQGFDVLGRQGWMLVMDSDIVIPSTIPQCKLEIGRLYTPHRRILADIAGMTELPDIPIESLPLHAEHGHYGYFQLFHSNDPVLKKQPWYEIDWRHAGGCDSTFQRRWHKSQRSRMPFEVIHLGPTDSNWFGRTHPRLDGDSLGAEATERLAMQQSLHRKYGWKGFKKTGEAVKERIDGDPNRQEDCHDQSFDKPQKRFIRRHRPKR